MNDRILVVCDDLFFWAQIHGKASALGRAAFRVADEAAMERAWEERGVCKVVVDLDSRSLDGIAWGAKWKSLPDPPKLIGFVSHVDLDTQERARRAGFDLILPKSRFTRTLSELL